MTTISLSSNWQEEKQDGTANQHGALQAISPREPVPYSLFTKNERRWIVALVAMAGWFSTLSSFIYYPVISVIAQDLESSISMINLTVTSYLIVSAIAPAIVGDAADTFGRRPLYIVTLTLYMVANIGIALQWSAVVLLLLRMLQSAGISGTFSLAYGVIADMSTPGERGAFVSALSFGSMSSLTILSPYPADTFEDRITTAPSLGPVLAGAFAAGPGWRWIFWFLVIASALCLVAIFLVLPETHRAFVGNGGTEPARLYRPFAPRIMRPWKYSEGLKATLHPRQPSRVPNPIRSIRVLSRKDVAISIMPGSFLYTVYSCIHASLATVFIEIYGLKEWQAGLIYLPFGVGAIISTLVSSRWIDHDYRTVAKAHGLPVDKIHGDNLLMFPIEKARLRSVLLPNFCAFASVLAYGWLVHNHVHLAAPLACLFTGGFSIQTCFNINNTLLVDINPDIPATAQASSNLVRCFLSAATVAAFQKLIDNMGVGLTFTLLSAMCVIASLFYLIELRCGRKWRLARNSM